MSAQVYILGGTNAIGNNLDSYLRNKGYTNIRRLYGNGRYVTTRLGGENRYETSVAIARYFFKAPDTSIFSSSKMMVLAYARNFADALVAGPLANKYHSPVVLVTNDNYQAAKNLSMVYDGVLTMGGASLVSDQTVSRIIGVI